MVATQDIEDQQVPTGPSSGKSTHLNLQGFRWTSMKVGALVQMSKGQGYERIWIDVPTRVSEDTSSPFKIGDPCLVQLDLEKKLLSSRR